MKGPDREIGASYRLEGTNQHAIFLIHGFTASAAAVRPLADVLHAAGYTVFAPNLKGHGETPENLRDFGWKDWREDALHGFDVLYAEYQHVSVIGHSLGGLLALLTAQQRPVWKCVSLAAGLRPKQAAQYCLPLLAPFQPMRPWSKEETGTGNPYAGIGYDIYPTAKLYDLNRLAFLARWNLRRIYCPLLCVTADADDVVHSASGRLIMQGVSSREKELLLLKDSTHNLLFDPAVNTLYEKVLAFLADSIQNP